MAKTNKSAGDLQPETRVGRPRSKDPRAIVAAGIKTSERAELVTIAESYGLTLNAVTTYFIRYALDQHRAKKFKIPTITKTVSVVRE